MPPVLFFVKSQLLFSDLLNRILKQSDSTVALFGAFVNTKKPASVEVGLLQRDSTYIGRSSSVCVIFARAGTTKVRAPGIHVYIIAWSP